MKVRLGDIISIKTGKLNANASSLDGKYPFFTCAIEPLKINRYSYDCECVLIAGNGDLNVKYYCGKFDAYQRTYIIESLDKQQLSVPYLYLFMSKYIDLLRNQAIGGVIKYIKLANITEAQLDIPTLSMQKKIVKTIGKLDITISKRKQQLTKLDELVKSRFMEMFGEQYEEITIGSSFITTSGGTPAKSNKEYYENGSIPWLTSGEVNSGVITKPSNFITELGLKHSSAKLIPANSVVIAMYGATAGQVK